MVTIPADLTILFCVLVLTLAFVQIGGTALVPERLQSLDMRRLGLGLYTLGLIYLIVVLDLTVAHERIVGVSIVMLWTIMVFALCFAGGPLNRTNMERGIGFLIGGPVLILFAGQFLAADFGGVWPDLSFRVSGGYNIAQILVLSGKAFVYLGNEICAAIAGLTGLLAIWRGCRLTRLPTAGDAARVLDEVCGGQRTLLSSMPPITPEPDEKGQSPAWWWNLYSTEPWQGAKCGAHLAAYVSLAGPSFPGSGIRLKDGFLRLDREVMNRLLDGNAVRFGPRSGRFDVTGRGLALVRHVLRRRG